MKEDKTNMYAYLSDSSTWVDPFGLAPIPQETLDELDVKLSEVNAMGYKKGVYEFIEKGIEKYTGSEETKKGTSTSRYKL